MSFEARASLGHLRMTPTRRRGRPAARLVFGNGIVVLVGDFCLARALETVASTGVIPVVQSLAATVKVYAVDGDKPVTANVVVAVVPIDVPFL